MPKKQSTGNEKLYPRKSFTNENSENLTGNQYLDLTSREVEVAIVQLRISRLLRLLASFAIDNQSQPFNKEGEK